MKKDKKSHDVVEEGPSFDAVAYYEERYPNITQRFKELQRRDYELFCKKQYDYGPGNISMGTPVKTIEDKRFSLQALNVRMNDKIQRLLNLMNRNQNDPQNESIEDAYTDLSVYGLIARLVSEGVWSELNS